MEVHPYEHPVKSGARRLVRQMLLSWVACSLIWFCIFVYLNSHVVGRDVASEAPIYMGLSIGFALPTALVAWLLYRIVRFAIG